VTVAQVWWSVVSLAFAALPIIAGLWHGRGQAEWYRRRRAELARWAADHGWELSTDRSDVAALQGWTQRPSSTAAHELPILHGRHHDHPVAVLFESVPAGDGESAETRCVARLRRHHSSVRVRRRAFSGYRRFVIKKGSAGLSRTAMEAIAVSRIPSWWIIGDYVVATDDRGWRTPESLDAFVGAVAAVAAALDAADESATPTAHSMRESPSLPPRVGPSGCERDVRDRRVGRARRPVSEYQVDRVPTEARQSGGAKATSSRPARSVTHRAAARRSVASGAGSAENSARRIRCCGPRGRRLWS